MKKISTLITILFFVNNVFAQNVGIGTTTPTKAGLIVNTKVGNAHAIFGDNTSGVSIESNFPGIHFNSYYNGGRKTISTGFTSGVEMNPSNGNFSIYTSPSATLVGNIASVSERFVIQPNGNVGIGVTNPSSLLQINGNLKINGTYYTELGADVAGKEINSGKIGWKLFSDGLDIVGAGTATPLTLRKVHVWAEGGTKFEGPIQNAAFGNINFFPVAMGTVNSSGGVTGGTGNFSVSKNTNSGYTAIIMPGFVYDPAQYLVIATTTSFSFQKSYATTENDNGTLVIWQWGTNPATGPVNAPFSFIIYKLY